MIRYRLAGRLETGELSELYAAIRDDDEAVVIKLFHARTSDVRYAQELAETQRLLRPVHAPGIVKIVEVGLVRDRLAVVRQGVDGITVGQLLQRLTAREFLLSPAAAVGIVVQLLELLGHAHAAGAVHGALTPGNVLLAPTGQPAIVDFGVLRALSAVPALRRTLGARGRDAYRAPEVVKGDVPTVESDVHSAGAILYELLTLKEPLADRTEGTIATRTRAVPPPSRLDRRLSARLDPIVLRALELSSTRRYHSAGEFAQALRNFLANNGGAAGNDEVRRVLEAMRAGDATVNLGPVPFSEPFSLREVRGAQLPPIAESVPPAELRPSFSGPLDVLDERTAEDGTDPGREERALDPEAGPARPRSGRPAPGSVLASRPVLRQPQGALPGLDDATPSEALTQRARAPDLSLEPPPAVLPPPPLRAMEVTGPIDTAALPHDTASDHPVGARLRRSRRRLYLALGLAAAAGLLLFVGMRRFSGPGALPTPSHPGASRVAAADDTTDPALRTVNGALRRYFETEGEGEPVADGAPGPFHAPAPREDAAFLSVTSDVAAVVYVDELRVRRVPPLVRYPVAPGVRRILIEASTGERRSFELTFEKGQLRRLDERFQK